MGPTRRTYGVITALVIILVLVITRLLVPRAVPVIHLAGPRSYRTQAEYRLWRLITRDLASPDGGIYRVQPTVRRAVADVPILSESVGLLMRFALATHDRRLFLQQVRLLHQQFIRTHLIAWEIVGTRRSPVNSTIDDLRILQAMLVARHEFDWPLMIPEVTGLAQGLLHHDGRSGWLVNAATASFVGASNPILAVRYWNVQALDRLVPLMPRVQPFAEHARMGLEHAENRDGWYAETYDVKTRTYGFGGRSGLNMDDQLITALNAEAAGISVTRFVRALQAVWASSGRIPLVVSPAGRTLNPSISPAVYAMAVRMFWHAGERSTADAIGRVLLAMQASTGHDPGAFAAGRSGAVYSFNQLEVLLTLQEVPLAH